MIFKKNVMSRTINYKEKYEKALKAITELLDKGDKEGLTIVSYRKDFEALRSRRKAPAVLSHLREYRAFL